MYYKLDAQNNIVPVDDVIEWGHWFESASNDRSRVVSQTRFKNGVFVSTVFLGLDHRFSGDGPPILFETMIFGGEHDEMQKRYCTWEEAFEGHQNAVKYFTDDLMMEKENEPPEMFQ
jgi:hypothetical protein